MRYLPKQTGERRSNNTVPRTRARQGRGKGRHFNLRHPLYKPVGEGAVRLGPVNIVQSDIVGTKRRCALPPCAPTYYREQTPNLDHAYCKQTASRRVARLRGRTCASCPLKSNIPQALYIFSSFSLRFGDTNAERLRNASVAIRTRLNDNLNRHFLQYVG